jgi:hypothetical protein
VIRQAITCDICGSEKQQTNHWFVACDHNGELRLAAWEGQRVRRSGLKHLCGQKCVHRLLDDFMAGHSTAAGHIPVAAPSIPFPAAKLGLIDVSSEPIDESMEESATLVPYPPEGQAFATARTSVPALANDRALTQLDPEAVRHADSMLRHLAWERERALLQQSEGQKPKQTLVPRIFGS